jgi:hypothetical protein
MQKSSRGRSQSKGGAVIGGEGLWRRNPYEE